MSQVIQRRLGQSQYANGHQSAIKVYDFIMRYYAMHGVSPSFMEMRAELDRGSGVAYSIELLIKMGWLVRDGNYNARVLKLNRPTERGLSPDQLAILLAFPTPEGHRLAETIRFNFLPFNLGKSYE